MTVFANRTITPKIDHAHSLYQKLPKGILRQQLIYVIVRKKGAEG